ncbi:MAG: AAA family ATPase, partial [Acidimicrobiales bacterium]
MSDAVPERLVVVVGTGTEIGKTWVACRLLESLRAAGVRVAARKPVQSYEPGDATTDAGELAAATGEERTAVCPRHRWYEVAMAPPMAAEALGRPPFDLAELIDEVTWPDDVCATMFAGPELLELTVAEARPVASVVVVVGVIVPRVVLKVTAAPT